MFLRYLAIGSVQQPSCEQVRSPRHGQAATCKFVFEGRLHEVNEQKGPFKPEVARGKPAAAC